MDVDARHAAELALRGSNALLLLGFLVHLLLRVRTRRANSFFIPWLFFWATFLAQYLIGYLLFPFWNFSAGSAAASDAVSLLNSFFLLAASRYLHTPSSGHPGGAWRKALVSWGISFVVVLLVLLAAGTTARVLILNFFSFLALAIYAGRYGKVVPEASGWATVLLYVYAATNLVFLASFGRSDQALLLALLAISVPLKIVLYYTGYTVLPRVALPVAQLSRTEDYTPEPTQSGGSVPASVLPPEPTVTIQFSGFWGFLYILWRYPSGKTVVLFILASLLVAIAFVASNVNAFVKALADAVSR